MAKSRNNPFCKVGDVVAVDMETGEETPIEGGGLRMMPGPTGSCEWCHTRHEPELPHNLESLPYQIKFKAINGRAPTWTDAMAHCTEEVRAMWRQSAAEVFLKLGMAVPPELLE